jgi:hypothetical protein
MPVLASQPDKSLSKTLHVALISAMPLLLLRIRNFANLRATKSSNKYPSHFQAAGLVRLLTVVYGFAGSELLKLIY